MTLVTVSIATTFLYIAAAGTVLHQLRRRASGLAERKPVTLALILAAVALHAWLVAERVLTPAGLNLGFFNALSLIGWVAATLMLISALRRPAESLGLVVLPFAAAALVLEQLFPAQHIILPRSPWPLEAHILVSVVAYSLLSLAAVQALVLAVQDYRLHHHQPGALTRALPPLQTMESLLFQMIGTGFVLLTLALLSGVLFLEDIFAQHLVHKTVLSAAAWVVFAILLWGRWRFGWRGRTAIRWTLGGFAALMLAYFGSKLVLELVLGR